MYLRLGLKAQSQSRATLKPLALLNNPQSVAFVRQQNIGVNQQVNNGAAVMGEPSRARETGPRTHRRGAGTSGAGGGTGAR